MACCTKETTHISPFYAFVVFVLQHESDPNLLAEDFVYLEPLMGPFDKEKYLQVFTEEYTVREGVPDLDYGLKVRGISLFALEGCKLLLVHVLKS